MYTEWTIFYDKISRLLLYRSVILGSSTIACVECYDADYNEWYDASPMNLSRSALSACVIAGLANAREYSYLGKARDLGQGQCKLNQSCRESQRRWLNLHVVPSASLFTSHVNVLEFKLHNQVRLCTKFPHFWYVKHTVQRGEFT